MKKKNNISPRVKCPGCGKKGECIRLKGEFHIYFANIKYVWYHCKRCDKKFLKKFPIEKKKK